MKCTIPEISWHNRDPVLSVDIQSKGSKDKTEFYRLASGGSDFHVLIWYMTINESGSVNLDLAADLTRHQKAVNVVKWSPNGELLATGDDESVIFIWKIKPENEILNIVDTTNEQDKEVWLITKILRGHMEDVYDLSWSPNSQFLVSGSVDNTAIIWDIQKGKNISVLTDHKGFVQGVSWDPLNQYIATLSTDRYMRIFDTQTKKVVSRSSKSILPVPKDHELHGKSVRLFHDDTLQTFFRRIDFSPDGKLLIAPSGVTDYNGITESLNTSYIYLRHSFKKPSILLPSPDQYTVAIKFCPVFFKLRPHNESIKPVIPLPYRMIFAVATKSSVHLYDTQQTMPFAMISNIHYTRLTDLTWSEDARILIVSSTDGFCSLITFTEGELGDIYDKVVINNDETKNITIINEKETQQKQKQSEMNSSSKISPEEIAMDAWSPKITSKISNEFGMEIEPEKKDIILLDNKIEDNPTSTTQDIRLVYEDTQESDVVMKDVEEKAQQNENEKKDVPVSTSKQNYECKTPRRVEFKTISTPKSKKKLDIENI